MINKSQECFMERKVLLYTQSKFAYIKDGWEPTPAVDIPRNPCALKEGASDAEKESLESLMNNETFSRFYKEEAYPSMKNPYYTWRGVVIDKG